jgi:hypothetical protein
MQASAQLARLPFSVPELDENRHRSIADHQLLGSPRIVDHKLSIASRRRLLEGNILLRELRIVDAAEEGFDPSPLLAKHIVKTHLTADGHRPAPSL